jgi:hypothetical protein
LDAELIAEEKLVEELRRQYPSKLTSIHAR